MKIQDDKFYQGSVIKEMFDKATSKTLYNPIGNIDGLDEKSKEKASDGKFQMSMFLSGMLLFSELEKKFI